MLLGLEMLLKGSGRRRWWHSHMAIYNKLQLAFEILRFS